MLRRCGGEGHWLRLTRAVSSGLDMFRRKGDMASCNARRERRGERVQGRDDTWIDG